MMAAMRPRSSRPDWSEPTLRVAAGYVFLAAFSTALVFVLRDIEDSSTEETAAQLGVRPETVKTRLHRARRLLRERLAPDLYENLGDTFPFCGAGCRQLRDRVLRLSGLGRKGFEALTP